ncbi:MAG TPA: 50S ribosomal protein L18 [Rickettsiales bacterium]|nr:50S ribosomal protein L18 [Rickettsiales bacterium]
MLNTYTRRKLRNRSKIARNNKSSRPKITVFRSNQNIYAQLISVDGKVLQAFSTLNFKEKNKASGIEKAKMVGQEFAKLCLKDGFTEVVFDKGAYNYNGRVKAVAEACREVGLKF